MANRYWVGGSATWDGTAGTKWSTTSGGAAGAAVPTPADNVIISQAGTYTITLGANVDCLNLTILAGVTVTIAMGSFFLRVYGSLIATATSTFTSGATFGFSFVGTNPNLFISANGASMSTDIVLNNTGGWSLGSTLTLGSTNRVTLTLGTLNLNGYDLTCGLFSSTNANNRSITFGSNNIILAHTTAGTTVIDMATATGFTWTGTTGGFNTAASITRTVTFGTTGGSALNSPILRFTGSGSAVQTITTGSWFKTLDFGTTAFTLGATNSNLSNLILSTSGTYNNLTCTMVGTGSITSNGKSILNLVINAAGITTTLNDALTLINTSGLTLNAGAINLNNFTLTTTVVQLAAGVTARIDFGTANIVLVSSGSAGLTAIAMASSAAFTYTGTGGFVSDASITRTYSFGSTSGGSATNAPRLTFTGSGTAVQTFTTGSWFNTLNFGTTAFNPGTTTLNVVNLTLSATGTYTALTPTMVGTGTITNNGIANLPALNITAGAGTVSLSAALTLIATSTVTLNSGTLNLNGFTLTCGAFSSANTNTRSINFGTANIVLIHTTAATTALSMATATGFTVTATTGGFTAAADVARTYVFGTTGGTAAISPNLTFTGSGTAIQTLTTASWFNKLDFGTTGFNAPAASVNLNGITLSSAGVSGSTLTITFVGTGTLSSNGGGIGAFTINNPGGTLTLGSSITTTGNAVITHTAGTFALNNFNISVYVWTGSGTATRAINFGTGNITTPYDVLNGTAISMPTATGITCSGTGGFVLTGTVNAKIVQWGSTAFVGGTSAAAPNITLQTGSSVITITTGSWFNTLNFSTSTYTVPATTLNISSLTLASGGNYANLTLNMLGTGTITPNGSTTLLALNINSTSGTTTLAAALTMAVASTVTLTSGTLNLNSFTLNIGRFISNASTTRVLAFGTADINLLTTTAAAVNIDMATMTGFSYTGTGKFACNTDVTRTFTVGSTLGGTSANAPSLRINTTTAGNVPTFTAGSWFNNLDLSVGVVTWAGTVNVNSITLGASGTYTSLNLTMVGTTSLNLIGKTLGNLTINTSGTVTAAAAIACSTFTMTAGTIDFASFNVTSTNATYTAGTMNNIGIISCSIFTVAGTYIFNAGTITATVQFSVTGSFTLGSGGTLTATPSFLQTSTSTVTLGKAYALTTTGTYTLTAGTLNLNGFDLTTGIFDSTGTGVRLITFGTNNIVLTHTTASTTVLSMSNLNNFSYTGTGGFTADALVVRTYNVGSTLGSATALNAPNLTFTGTGTAIPVINGSSVFNKLDFGSTAFGIATTSISLRSFTLSSGGTFTGLNATTIGDGTLTSNGKTIGSLSINHGGGATTTTTLAGALSCSTYDQTGGNFNCATFNVTCSGAVTHSLGDITNIGTFSCTTWTEIGTFTLNSGILTCSTSFSTSSSAIFNYNAGTLNTPAFTQTNGTVNINKALALTLATGTYTFTAGTLNLNSFNLTCGSFSSSNANSRTLNFGTGNIILNHTTAGTTVLNMATVTNLSLSILSGGFVSDASVTRTYTFGTTGGAITNAPNLTINSGAAIPTFTDGSWFNILNFTGSTCAPVMSASALGIFVSKLTLATGGTYTGFIPSFTTSQTWIPQFSKQLGGMGVNIPAAGGTLQMGGVQSFTGTSVLFFGQGALDLGGYDLTIGRFVNAFTTGGRVIVFGSNNIILNHTTAGTTVLDMATLSNYNQSGTGGFRTDASITRTINSGASGGASNANLVRLTLTGSGTSVITFTTGSWFGLLNFGTTAFNPGTTALNLASLTLSSGGTFSALTPTFIFDGTITSNGNTTLTGLTVNGTGIITTLGSAISMSVTSAANLTAGTLNLNNFTLSCGTFVSSGSITRSISFGTGNIVMYTTTPAIGALNMAIVTGFTWTGTGAFVTDGSIARTVTFGTTGGTSTNAPNLTLTGSGSGVITFTSGSWFNILDFGPTNGSNPGGTINVNSVIAPTGVSGSISNASLTFVGTGTITPNGKTFGFITINNGSGTTTLAGALNTGGGLNLTAATNRIDFAGFSATFAGTFTYSGGTLLNIGTITCSSWTTSADFTLSSGTLTITSTLTIGTPAGQGFTYGSGATLSAVPTINHNAGFFTLNKAYATTVTGSYNFNGSASPVSIINLNGYNLSVGVFTTALGGLRTINFGSNDIIITNTTAGVTTTFDWNATSFSYTGTGGFVADASVTRTFTFGATGGTATPGVAPRLRFTGSGTAVQTITSNTFYGALDFGTTAFTLPPATIAVGSLTLSSAGTYTSCTFDCNISSGTVITNGKIFDNLRINRPGITITLGDALTLSGVGTLSSIQGTINLNNFTATVGTFYGSYASARSVLFGTGNIVLANTGAGTTVLNVADATNFTYTGTGGFVADASTTRTYSFGSTSGGSVTNAPRLTLTGSGTSVQTFTTNSWFNTLNFGTTAFNPGTTTLNVGILTLSSGGTFTGLTPILTATQTWTPQFSQQLGGMGYNAAGGTLTFGGTQSFVTNATFTLTQGTVVLNGYDITVGIFTSSNSNTRGVTFGTNNIILAHTTAGTTVLEMTTGNNFTAIATTGGFVSDASITRTFNGGNFVSAAPNLTFTGSGTAIQTFLTQASYNKLDFGTTAFTIAVITLRVNSITLSPGGTFTNLTLTVGSANSVLANSSGTIISNGRTLGPITITADVGATYSTILGDALTLGSATTLTMLRGNFNLNGFTATVGVFSRTGVIESSIAFGTGNIVLIGTGTVLSVADASIFTWSGTGGFSADATVSRAYNWGSTGTASYIGPNLTFTGTGATAPSFTSFSRWNTLDFGTTTVSITLPTVIFVNGFVLSPGGTFTGFQLTVGGGSGSYRSNGKTIGFIQMTTAGASGVTCTLLDSMIFGTGTSFFFFAGTINLNGFTLTCDAINASGTSSRQIQFGTGNIILVSATAASTILQISDATNFTCTGTGGFVISAAGGAATHNYLFGQTGGSATNAPNLTFTSGAAVPTFFDGSWFNNLNFTGTTSIPAMSATNIGIYVNTLTLATGGTYTGFIPIFTRTQTWTAQFAKQLLGIGFNLVGGTLTLDNTQTYVASTSKLFAYAGTINFGAVAITIGTVTIAGGTLTNIATITSVTFVVNSGATYTHTSGTINTTNLQITGTFSFAGGTLGTITSLQLLVTGIISSASNITCTTLTSTGGSISNAIITANTSYTFSTGTTTIVNSTLTGPIIVSSGTLTYTGGTLSAITSFTHTAGTVTLQNNLTLAATSTYTFTAGTLNVNGFTLTVGIFSSSNANARTLNFGTGLIALAHTTAAQTVLSMATATNFALSGTGGFTTQMTVTRTFDFGATAGGSSTNAPNLSITSGASVPTFNGSGTAGTTNSWFNILNFTGSTCTPTTSGVNAVTNVSTLILATGGTYTTFNPTFTRTQTWTAQFSKQLGGMGVNGAGITLTLDGTQSLTTTAIFTLNNGTLNLGGFNLTVGTFSTNNSNTRSIQFGSNNIITTGGNLTAVDGTTATGFTWTGTGGFVVNFSALNQTCVFGTTGGTAVNAPNLSIGAGSLQITITNGSWFNSIIFSSSYTGAMQAATNINAATVTLSPSGVYNSGIGFTATATGTYTTYNATLITFTINHAGITTLGGNMLVTQGVALSGFQTTTLTAGTLNLNTYTLTTGIFSSSNANTRSINFTQTVPGQGPDNNGNGSGYIDISNNSVAASTCLNMAIVTGFTYTGTGGFYTNGLTTRTVTFGTTGGTTTNAPNLLIIFFTNAITITTGSWFNTLSFYLINSSGVTVSYGGTVPATTVNVNNLRLGDQAYQQNITANMVGAGTITTNEMPIAALTINHTGTTTLVGNLQLSLYASSTATTTLTSGTLDLNGYTLYTGSFSSDNSNTRRINFGSNNIVLNNTTNGATVLSMATATGFVFSGSGGFTTDAERPRTITVGSTGESGNSVNLTYTGSGTNIPTLVTNSRFNKLNFGTTAFTLSATTVYVSILTLSSASDYTAFIPIFTRTQTWVPQFSKVLGGMGFALYGGTLTLGATQTLTSTSTFTLINGTLNLGGFDLTVGIFAMTNPTVNVFGRAITFGSNNIILAHPTASTTVLNATSAVNFTCTGTGGFVTDASITRTISFGSSNATGIGTPPNLTFTGSGTSVVTLTASSRFNKLDFGTTGFTVNNTSPGLNIYSLVLSSNVLANFGVMFVTFVGTGTINFNGVALGQVPTINHIDNVSTTTLLSAGLSGGINLTKGALVLNNFTWTLTQSFASNNTNIRSIAFGTGNIQLGSGSIASPWVDMATVTNFTTTGTGGFVGGTTNQTYNFGSVAGATQTNAPNLSFPAGAGTVTFTTGSFVNKLDFSGSTQTTSASTVNVNSLTLSTTGAFGSLTVVTIGTGTIISNGNTSLLSLTFGTGTFSPTTTLGAALTLSSSRTVTLTNGTLVLANYTLTTGIFSSTNTNTRAISFGSGNISLNGTSVTVLNMTILTGFSWTGTGGFVLTIAISPTITVGTTGGTAANAPNLAFTESLSTTRFVTITVDSWFNKFDCSASTITPVMSTFTSTSYINISTLLLSSSSLVSYASFVPALTSTQTWTSQYSKQLGGIGVNTPGVTVTLDNTQSYGNSSGGTPLYTSWLQLIAGTINLGGFDLTIGGINSSNTNTRAIAFGSNNIILSHTTSGTTIMAMNFRSNFSWTGTGGFSASMWVNSTLAFGSSDSGVLSNAPNLTFGAGTGIATFTGGSWFNNLNFATSQVPAVTTVFNTAGVNILGTLTLSSSGIYTSFVPIFTTTLTWTAQYGHILGGIGINGAGQTLTLDSTQTYTPTTSQYQSSVYLYAGTLNLGGVDLTVGGFSSNNSNTRVLVMGTANINLINPNSGQTALDMATMTGFSWTGTGRFITDATVTRTFSVGSTAGGTPSNAVNLSITSGSTAPTFTAISWFNNLDFTGTTFTALTASVYVATLTLSTNGTYTALTPILTRTQTWTMQFSKQLAGLGFNLSGGTLTLDGTQTFITNTTFTLIQGTLNLGGFNLTVGIFSSNVVTTRAIAFGSNNIILNHTTAATTVLDMGNLTGFSFTGTGGFTADVSVTRTYSSGSTAGGSPTTGPNLTLTGPQNNTPTFTATSWFNKLDFGTCTCTPVTSPYVNTLLLSNLSTYTSFAPILTRTQTWTAQFGKQFAGLGFNLAGGTLTLDNTQTYTATSTFTLEAGTLDLGGTNLTIGIFSSSNNNTRSIAFSNNYIILAHTTAATNVLSMTNATGFTWTGAGGFRADASVTRTYTFGSTAGASVSNAPNLFIISGSNSPTFSGLSWFNKLDFTGSTCAPAANNTSEFAVSYINTLILATGGTYTAFAPVFTSTQTWTMQFSKQLGGIGVNGTGVTLTLEATQTYSTTSFAFLIAGTLNLGGANLTVGGFISNNTNTRSITFGSNNIVLNHATAATTVISMANMTGFSYTGTGGFTPDAAVTRTYTIGTTAGGTTTNAPNVTLTGAGSAIGTFTTGSWFNTLNFGTTGFAVAATTLNVNGLVLSTGGTFTSLNFNLVGTGTLNGNGKQTNAMTFNHTGITTMASAITVGAVTFTAGTLNLAGFTFSTFSSISSAGTAVRAINGPGNITITGALTPWTVTDGTNFTGSGYNINIATTNNICTFAGGGGKYGTLVYSGTFIALTITGSNTFDNINVTSWPAILTYTDGTTQTVGAFSATGLNESAFVKINSTTAGSQASLSNPNQVISVNYMEIQDSNATGGASWYAGTTSTNISNNTGWFFTAPPTPATINNQGFFLM